MNKKLRIGLSVILILAVVIVSSIWIASTIIGSVGLRYPVVRCIIGMDQSMNVGYNKLPITVESQREAIQWRCAKEYVDFNATYDGLLVVI